MCRGLFLIDMFQLMSLVCMYVFFRLATTEFGVWCNILLVFHIYIYIYWLMFLDICRVWFLLALFHFNEYGVCCNIWIYWWLPKTEWNFIANEFADDLEFGYSQQIKVWHITSSVTKSLSKLWTQPIKWMEVLFKSSYNLIGDFVDN